MHHIYHTPGIILSSVSYGEANRYFKIFTKDFGLVEASAQGVRFLKSKLRYAIHDFSYCDLSLVRGREVWRVTGVLKHTGLYSDLKGSAYAMAVFARVFSLLERLLHGEEKNEKLWKFIEEAILFARAKTNSPILVPNFEYVLVLRVLYSLGYLGLSPDTAFFVESPYWNDGLLLKMNEFLPKVLAEINKSLKESQL